MSVVLLDTTNIGEAEEVFGAQFLKVRMSPAPGESLTRTRVYRSWVGTTSIDDTDFSFDVDFESEPLDKIMLTRIRSGLVTNQQPNGDPHTFGPDDVMAVGELGKPVAGTVHRAHYDVIALEARLFSEVAAGPPGSQGPVHITSPVPMCPSASRNLGAVIDDMRATAHSNPEAVQNPLIAGAMQRHLAASMLVAFPSTALLDPTFQDRHDSTPQLLRRAIAFIEDNADIDICLADIARAIYVTPRALQYMFRKHRDCTPLEYLRRVRLHHAHHELIRSSRYQTTVAAIAVRWGFAHVGRFSVYYRMVYGQSPHVTLKG